MNNWEDKKGQIMQFIIEHPLLRNAAVDRTDGYKFTSEDIWVHIRSSQTEPIVRIISEGKDAQQVMNLVKDLEQACVG